MTFPLPLAVLRTLRPVLPHRLRVPDAFETKGYRLANADVAARGGNGLLHFLRHGQTEGRLPCRLQAAALESALWTGDDTARAALLALQSDGGAEGLWARLALARATAVQQRDWAKALGLLADPERLMKMFGLLDPMVFLAEMAFRSDNNARANAALQIASMRFGPHPAILLLKGAMRLQAGDEAGWSALLAPLYGDFGLRAPVLEDGTRPAIDRLAAKATQSAQDSAPLVSVLVPARNAAKTIDAALASLAAQSWRQIEVLVVDNGSTDATAIRAAEWAAKDSRFRLIDGSKAAGAYDARNLAAGFATGALITVQDADDWSHPDRIAQQVRALLAAPDRPANLSHWLRMTPDLCPVLWRPDVRPVHANLSSLLIRREVIDRIGLWDLVRFGADTEYIERLRRVFGAAAVQEVLPGLPLAFGRHSEGSLTQSELTGLIGPGAAARHGYLTAARAWHSRTPQPYLPAQPRPFAVPAALQVTKEDPL